MAAGADPGADKIEWWKRRVGLVQALLACATAVVIAIGGSVAWAQSFQTKKEAAATAAAQTALVAKAQDAADAALAKANEDSDRLGDLKAALDRVENKEDRVILMLAHPGVRR